MKRPPARARRRAAEVTGDILVRDLEGIDEAHAAEDLQREIWGMSDLDITSAIHLVAAKKAGG